MTAEVCILNRRAAVLAADSATTVTRWTKKGKETRYFKGANKIFQLSDHHPMGIMIFDSADLMAVPWETTIKSFRTSLGTKSFNTVAEYAKEFFGFLSANRILFPDPIRKSHLLSAAKSATLRILFNVTKQTAFDANKPLSDSENIPVAQAYISQLIEDLKSADLPSGVTTDEIKDITSQFGDEIAESANQALDDFGIREALKDLDLTGVLIDSLFRNPSEHFSNTGIVFCGFGDHDIFPTMQHYHCSGILKDRSFTSLEQEHIIDHSTSAAIQAFAQTAMADTFQIGVSSELYGVIRDSVTARTREFANTLVQGIGGGAILPPDIDALIEAVEEQVASDVIDSSWNSHALPMRQVLASLPIDEMSELAETLVALQSLKEKVTSSTETVGGPIDVAVITKSEGLVWIKRKHFFDSALNTRYHLRQSMAFK